MYKITLKDFGARRHYLAVGESMKQLYILSSILSIFFFIGCSGKQVKVDPKAPVEIHIPEYAPTRTEIRSAIVAASHSLGWSARDRAPGVLHVVYKIPGRETITLEVNFSAMSYTINYKDSSRKAYNAESGKIHPYFESFAKELHLAIAEQLPKITEPEPNITVKPNVSIDFDNTSVADNKEREETLERLKEEKKRQEERKERIARITSGKNSDKAVEIIGSKKKDNASPSPDTPSVPDSQMHDQHESLITLHDIDQEPPHKPALGEDEVTAVEKTAPKVSDVPPQDTAPKTGMQIKDLTPQENAVPTVQAPIKTPAPAKKKEQKEVKENVEEDVVEKAKEDVQKNEESKPSIAPSINEDEE